jgi:hypothetical protein
MLNFRNGSGAMSSFENDGTCALLLSNFDASHDYAITIHIANGRI